MFSFRGLFNCFEVSLTVVGDFGICFVGVCILGVFACDLYFSFGFWYGVLLDIDLWCFCLVLLFRGSWCCVYLRGFFCMLYL